MFYIDQVSNYSKLGNVPVPKNPRKRKTKANKLSYKNYHSNKNPWMKLFCKRPVHCQWDYKMLETSQIAVGIKILNIKFIFLYTLANSRQFITYRDELTSNVE